MSKNSKDSKNRNKQNVKPCFQKLVIDTLERLVSLKTDQFQTCPKVEISNKTTDIELQIEGYGLFEMEKIFTNFSNYLIKLISKIKSLGQSIVIKSFKLVIQGFKIYKKGFFSELAKSIKEIGLNIKILWIHTNDIENLDLKDFQVLFKLMGELGGHNNTNFEQFSLQCANWKFTGGQPQFKQFYNSCKQIFRENVQGFEEGQNTQIINYFYQKKVRIEISGWWYSKQDANDFFNFNIEEIKQKSQEQYDRKIMRFHQKMIYIISNLVEMCAQIEVLELDMRNNHEFLQMSKLKDKITKQITKSDRHQKSLISIRKVHKGEEQQKLFRVNAAM